MKRYNYCFKICLVSTIVVGTALKNYKQHDMIKPDKLVNNRKKYCILRTVAAVKAKMFLQTNHEFFRAIKIQRNVRMDSIYPNRVYFILDKSFWIIKFRFNISNIPNLKTLAHISQKLRYSLRLVLRISNFFLKT